MKKRLLRLSKRILILTLCTILLSGSVINRYKITANATSIAASIGAYGASEICVFLGNCLVALLGIGATAEVYQNRDTIAQLGKDFIDSLDLDEVSGWMLAKVDTTGQSYVYGTEALKEIQDMEFTVIQGGNNMPENNNDNDDDGDIDADDRTKELEQMGMWATTYLVEIMEDITRKYIERYQFNYRPEVVHDFLFCDVHGKPITADAIRNVFCRAEKRTGIERLHPHLLRHTFATSFIIGGGSLELLRIYMGHSDIATTQQYMHVVNAIQFSDNIYQLDDIFFKRMYY